MVFENLKKVSFNIASEASYLYSISNTVSIKKTEMERAFRPFCNMLCITLHRILYGFWDPLMHIIVCLRHFN